MKTLFFEKSNTATYPIFILIIPYSYHFSFVGSTLPRLTTGSRAAEATNSSAFTAAAGLIIADSPGGGGAAILFFFLHLLAGYE